MDEDDNISSIISFGSHRSKISPQICKSQHQLNIKVETLYSLLSMLTCFKEEMCNKFYTMSQDPQISREMKAQGCIPLLIQLIHPMNNGIKTLGALEIDDEENEDSIEKELEIRRKACQSLHNMIKFDGETKKGKREMRVLLLLEEIRKFCEQFRQPNFDKGINIPHPGEVMSYLMKVSFDEKYREAICILGGLQAVAELIYYDTNHHGNTTASQCITLRRYAFMALTNLTFGDSTSKSILCSNKQFIKSLIDQLYSPSEELRQVTASVLRNLSWKADENSKCILREMSSVSTLMKAALTARKESTLKSILTALWNLSAHSTANKAEICNVDGALEFLVSTLTYKSVNNSIVIIENGGGILRNISSYIAIQEKYRAILREHNCLSILLEQLKSPSLTIVSNACATLWNLSARCAKDQKKLIELGAVPMLRNLVNSKHKMISTGSYAALKNLSAITNNALISLKESVKSERYGPSLQARKFNHFRLSLDDNVSETCDNIDTPKSSPTHRETKMPHIKYLDRMSASFTAATSHYVARSTSRNSLDSTHSEPIYLPYNGFSNLNCFAFSGYPSKQSCLTSPDQNFPLKSQEEYDYECNDSDDFKENIENSLNNHDKKLDFGKDFESEDINETNQCYKNNFILKSHSLPKENETEKKINNQDSIKSKENIRIISHHSDNLIDKSEIQTVETPLISTIFNNFIEESVNEEIQSNPITEFNRKFDPFVTDLNMSETVSCNFTSDSKEESLYLVTNSSSDLRINNTTSLSNYHSLSDSMTEEDKNFCLHIRNHSDISTSNENLSDNSLKSSKNNISAEKNYYIKDDLVSPTQDESLYYNKEENNKIKCLSESQSFVDAVNETLENNYNKNLQQLCDHDTNYSLTDNNAANSFIDQTSISAFDTEDLIITVKPPNFLDEANLSAGPNSEVIYDSLSKTQNMSNELLLESINPPSAMEQISAISSSCGSINSLYSEVNDISEGKDFDPVINDMIKKHTDDLILLTRSHSNDTIPQYEYSINDIESEEDSRATYICSPKRATIVRPVTRPPIHINKKVNAKKSNESLTNYVTSPTGRGKSFTVKATKTSALRASRTKPGSENEEIKNATMKRSLSSCQGYSNRTFVIRKKLPLDQKQEKKSSNTNDERYKPTRKLCNSSSLHSIGSNLISNSIISITPKKVQVRSKIASLWKKNPGVKDNTTDQKNNCNRVTHKSINKSTSLNGSSMLTRSSTYEKLPTTEDEALRMNCKVNKESKENKSVSTKGFAKSRIRPTQEAVSILDINSNQNKAIKLEKKKVQSVL